MALEAVVAVDDLADACAYLRGALRLEFAHAEIHATWRFAALPRAWLVELDVPEHPPLAIPAVRDRRRRLYADDLPGGLSRRRLRADRAGRHVG